MKFNLLMLALGSALTLGACSSSAPEVPANPLTTSIPQWVLNPVIDNAIAASDCVKFSGNMSIDQKMASANARQALAQQIETRVESLDKTYSNRTDSNNDTTTGSSFSSVSKQITNQKLNGSRIVKSDIVKIAGKDHLCSMVMLDPKVTQELFSSIIDASKKTVNPQDEKFLYQEFKAYKAEQDLDKAIERLTN